MRRSPLRKLVALSLLLLLAMNPGPSREPPPIISPSATPIQSWEPLRQRLDEAAMRDAATTTSTVPKTATAAKPTTTRPVSVTDGGAVADLICTTFGDACAAAVRVARCESTFNPSAVNGRYRGVFQVGDMHADEWLEVTGKDYWESWMVAELNVSYAHSLYLRLGWVPWSCKP